MELLLQVDYRLFELINQEWTTPLLDVIFPWWREKTTWIPLYVLLLAGSIWKYRWLSIYWLVGLLLTVGLTDTLSHRVIKKNVQRPRPCHEVTTAVDSRALVDCGSGYSFTSNHASNHFGIALFLIATLGSFFKWMRWLLLFWAASIAYGQVYVGVHYPLDVVAGALLGSLVAWGVLALLRRWVPRLFLGVAA